MANKGFTTATDFADFLVKEKNLSFRESYSLTAKLVNFAEKNDKSLDQLSLIEIRKIYKNVNKDVLKIFNIRNSMTEVLNAFSGIYLLVISNTLNKYLSNNKNRYLK